MFKKKKVELSSEGKTELAKSIGERSQKIKRTYDSFEITMAKSIKWLSSCFDKLLFNKKYAKIVALVLAFFLYTMVNFGSNGAAIFSSNQNSIKIMEVPVKVNVNNTLYEVEGVPETVTLRLIGDLTDISQVKMQGQYEVVLELNGLSEGTHDVSFSVLNVSDRVEAIVEPTNVAVKISKKTSKTFKVGYDFINTDKMDSKYTAGTPVFSQSEVTVRGSQETLDKIALVKALIDVSGQTSDFESDATLIAVDKQGNRVNVDFAPTTVKVTVPVTSPSKDVPLELEPVGVLPDGLAIDSYTIDHQAITIFGNLDLINNIDKIKLQLPVFSIKEDCTKTVPINLPSGVNSSNVSKVNISLKLTKAVEKEFKNIPIGFINNTKGYKLAPVDGEKVSTTVKVTGSSNQLSAFKAESLNVYIDLKEVSEPGIYELNLYVKGDNPLLVYKTTSKIKMEVKAS